VPAAAWAALDAAAVFASELGVEEPDPRLLAEHARLPWGQVLDRMLPADDWWELVTAMAGAMSEDQLRHARPWFALLRLRSHVARSPRPSMDFALAERARARGIAVESLESWQQQVAALSTAVTVADLSAAIHARHTVACELARLRAAYAAGDLAALTRMLVIPGRSDELLDERNRRWLPQIERYLADRGAFVAVGLGHLLGDAGLLVTLERAGYIVERRADLQARAPGAAPSGRIVATGRPVRAAGCRCSGCR
ncbi:MAG TPA: TraB/GumN family protein, partial [Kofleriaceae bacterium]|nr:TraB/GumN family protein [Kofleriaceae bacterium]